MRALFFFNDTATTEIYTLSLHDALPISGGRRSRRCSSAASSHASAGRRSRSWSSCCSSTRCRPPAARGSRSEEHTSELQSRQYLVCRLLLEKKKRLHQMTVSVASSLVVT